MNLLEKSVFGFLRLTGIVKIMMEKKDIEKCEKKILWQLKNNLHCVSSLTREVGLIYIENGGKKIFEKISQRTKDLFSDLGVNIKFFSSIQISSYDDQIHGKKPILTKRLDRKTKKDVEGIDVFVFDDLIQTGRTCELAENYLLKECGASKVVFCHLIKKNTKERQILPTHLNYGEEIDGDKYFLIGNGLDFCDDLRKIDCVIGINENFFELLKNDFVREHFISLIKKSQN
jgi:hypoxanthine-guanine phosphoribosyltransferase